ncbi:recombinase family protein [Actinomadura rupiterrae]|uniref:recombinase family protein n=1 Tax=Actinomadura rupiterrae TaxID=559627 RepID=UPI00355897F3
MAVPARGGAGVSDGEFPWPWMLPEENAPTAPQAMSVVPVAWLGRTSTEDQQDPTLSLPRQLATSRRSLPQGYVIVAHFYDVESGRKELEARGQGRAHEQFDIAVPRDGGIQDLLDEATRPDRRFVAVICESIERVARRTYLGTKIEYQLEQAGVILLAADEPMPTSPTTGGAAPKRATPILTRRVKQAVAEWYVLQLLENSWEGTREHIRQGWNIGPAPYGYDAERVPHPVPARRAQGKTKSRLIPNPVRGPVVTMIFMWRATERIGYREIADRLDQDPDRFPPPVPTRPERRVGRWTRSAVREILHNPKYTGYMVWNRRATKQGGRLNPPSEWTWSPRPVHEPLVAMEVFKAVHGVDSRAVRARVSPSLPPQSNTVSSYALRSFVECHRCDRRMRGRRRHGHKYHVCEIDKRHHRDRREWYPDHPSTYWVREEYLLAAVEEFFSRWIFGPHRRELLAAQLGEHPQDDWTSRKRGRLEAEIADLRRRRANLISQLELADGDDREFRESIRRRFAQLGEDIDGLQSEITAIDLAMAGNDPRLLELLPQAEIEVSRLPVRLQQKLFGVFRLRVRYDAEGSRAIVQVTLRAQTADELARDDGAGPDPGPAEEGDEMNPRTKQLFVTRKCVPPTGFEPALPP